MQKGFGRKGFPRFALICSEKSERIGRHQSNRNNWNKSGHSRKQKSEQIGRKQNQSEQIPSGDPKFLGWHVCRTEVCTKDFFSRHEISHGKCSEISPEIVETLVCGSEKIPENSRQISCNISLPKITKKIHRRASAGAQGEQISNTNKG